MTGAALLATLLFAAADPCLTNEPATAGPELVASTDGQLLAWNRDSEAQIRRKGGGWTPVNRVAPGEVTQVVGDPAGFLLLRRRPGAEALLLDRNGAHQASWKLGVGDGDDVSLFSDAAGRWLSTNKIIRSLGPRATLGPEEPLPRAIASRVNPAVPFPPVPPAVLLGHDDGSLLVCLPRSPFKEGHGDGICERTGSGSWQIAHRFDGPALRCGEWLVLSDENDVAVRAARTGAALKSRRIAARGPLTCAGPDRLAVGGKSLTILSLPSLSPLYQRKLAGGRIASLAFLRESSGDSLAFTNDRPGVNILSMTCALASKTSSAR